MADPSGRCPWPCPAAFPVLGPSDVHVWCAELDGAALDLRQHRQLLAPDERQRAERFHFERDHRRFTVSRAVLRRILARYLAVDPSSLRFEAGPSGKPALEGRPKPLRFNVSHSGGLALYAVARTREVGVDIECVRPDLATDDVARQNFSPAEVDALLALAPADRVRGFFDCWTRKEAYIKARGEGLSHPLNRFSVSLAPGEPPRLLATPDDPEECRRWALEALEPAPAFAGALVVESGPGAISTWRFPDVPGVV